MTTPKKHDTVVISCTGKLDNGELFYQTENNQPLQLQIGNSQLPPTVEEVVTKMQIGETRKVRVSPDEGFGPRQKELLQTIESQEMVNSVKPLPGMILSLKVEKDGKEQQVPATVMSVEDARVTVDYNHPLAGHHLTYEIELLEINPETAR